MSRALRFDRARAIIIIILFSTTTALNSRQDGDPASVGVGEYPYMLAVCQKFSNDVVKICGGTLIKPDWIVTSQNCKAGTGNQRRREVAFAFAVASIYDLKYLMKSPIRLVQSWINHPEFGKTDLELTNDLALLYLDSSYIINQNMHDILLASESILNGSELHTKFPTCIFTFWRLARVQDRLLPREMWLTNYTESTQLYSTIVKILSDHECKRNFGDNVLITNGQVCGRVTVGDLPPEHSGGPLVCGGVQFAVFSWQRRDRNGRVVPIFTRVDVFEKYITSIVPDLDLATIKDISTVPKKIPSNKYVSAKNSGNLNTKSAYFNIACLILANYVSINNIYNY